MAKQLAKLYKKLCDSFMAKNSISGLHLALQSSPSKFLPEYNGHYQTIFI